MLDDFCADAYRQARADLLLKAQESERAIPQESLSYGVMEVLTEKRLLG